MSTLTPNELTYPVTPPAIDAAAGPAVVIAGGGPTGLMLAAELALAGPTLPLSSRAPARTFPARARAACTHAPSRFSISVESLTGSCRRDRWLRFNPSPRFR